MTAQEQLQLDRQSSKYNSFREGNTINAPPMARRPVARTNTLAPAKIINIANNVSIQTALSGAQPGDTVNFDNVTTNAPVDFKNDLNYTGSLTVTTDTKSFAIKLPNPSHNINIDMKLRANCGLVLATGPQADNTFRGDWQWGGNGTYYNRVAMRALSGSTRCTFAFYPHDSLSSDRTLDLYNTTDCVFDMEQFNVNDGGHVDGTHNGDNFKKWIVRNVKRMGLEYQDQGSSGGSNITFNQPTTIDHVNPYNESFGLSIMPQRHTNVKIIKPYVRAGTATIVSGSHKGIGIEFGAGAGSSIDGAVVIGDYVEAFAFSMKTPCSNARIYGKQQWGIYNTEGGLNGNGSFVDGGGNQPAPGLSTGMPIEQAPLPLTTTTTEPPPMPAKILTPLAGTIFKPGQNVTASASGSQSFDVDCVGDGLPSLPMVVAADGLTCVFIVPKTATSAMRIRVTAIGPGGSDTRDFAIDASGVVTPPPDPDPVIETTQITVKKHKSGKLETSAVTV